MPREIVDQKSTVVSQENEEDDYLYDEVDEPFEDEENDGSECGRWDNGRLIPQCAKAGTEECDWECPIGLPARHR